MEIIEQYGCTWQTIQEKYDTETTNGQFLINIKMAMEEAELSQTSDRVKTVLNGKRMRGEPYIKIANVKEDYRVSWDAPEYYDHNQVDEVRLERK